MFDASRILVAGDAFDWRYYACIIQKQKPCVAALLPLVVHEDNHQLVVFKPAGWLSQPDATGDPPITEIFAAYLKEKYQKPGNAFCAAVQRLDRPAQGLMVLARTSKGAARISAEIRSGQFYKKYHVLTLKPLRAAGRISERMVLSADMQKIDRMARRVENIPATDSSPGMRYLVTAQLVSAGKVFQYEVIPEGGKYHQIRALFAAYGAPLLGDVRYGGPPLQRGRIALLASLLRYRHPTTGSWQIFSIDDRTLARLPDFFTL